MPNFPHSPFLWLAVEKDGTPKDPSVISKISAALDAAQATDLVFMSHGWKNDEAAAEALYRELWYNTGSLLGAKAARTVVVGVQWPAARYPKRLAAETSEAAAAGGVQSMTAGHAEPGDITDGDFDAELGQLLGFLKPNDQVLKTAAVAWSKTRQQDDADTIFARGNIARVASVDPELSKDMVKLPTQAGLRQQALVRMQDEPSRGAASGGVQDLQDVLFGWTRGPKSAVIKLLEQFSFYEMKARAGTVGAVLGNALESARPTAMVKLHLVGHSFGARLVTAFAKTFDTTERIELFSLTLLQGAYSHSGLSVTRHGAFATVAGRPTGPISITHTHNDKACFGIYAWATRLSGDTTQAIGDKNDAFGAMGANGAQDCQAIEVSASSGFAPESGKITNYRADAYIKDHGDVRNPVIGRLLAAAIQAPVE